MEGGLIRAEVEPEREIDDTVEQEESQGGGPEHVKAFGEKVEEEFSFSERALEDKASGKVKLKQSGDNPGQNPGCKGVEVMIEIQEKADEPAEQSGGDSDEEEAEAFLPEGAGGSLSGRVSAGAHEGSLCLLFLLGGIILFQGVLRHEIFKIISGGGDWKRCLRRRSGEGTEPLLPSFGGSFKKRPEFL